MKFEDVYKLIEFAREGGFSIKINYWESADELEVEVVSAAKAENFYMKRVPTVDYFIEQWKKSLEGVLR